MPFVVAQTPCGAGNGETRHGKTPVVQSLGGHAKTAPTRAQTPERSLNTNVDPRGSDVTGRGSRRAELMALARLGVPLAGANLAELGMALTDMAIVGRLGAVEFAAVGLAGGVIFDIESILAGVLTVVGVLVAEAYGRGERERVGAIAGQGLRIAMLLALPLVAMCLLLPAILSWTGQDAEVLALGAVYLNAVVWSFPFFMAYAVLVDVATALHRPRMVFLVSSCAVAVNAVLSWYLVFGLGPWQGLGVAGAGYATSIVNAVMVTALAVACFGTRDLRSWLPMRALLRGDRAAGRDIVKVGLPVAGMTLAESGMFTVVMVLIGGFGAVALAASKMVFGYVQVAGAFAFAAADAAAIRVALAAGRGDRAGVSRAGILACIVGTAILILLALVPLAFPYGVAGVFLGELRGEDLDVAEQARLLFGIGALYLVLQGLQTIAEHALRGLRDTLVPMWQSLAGLWLIGLAGGALLAYGLGMGVAGLWWGMAAGSGITALLFLRRFAVLGARIGSPDQERKTTSDSRR